MVHNDLGEIGSPDFIWQSFPEMIRCFVAFKPRYILKSGSFPTWKYSQCDVKLTHGVVTPTFLACLVNALLTCNFWLFVAFATRDRHAIHRYCIGLNARPFREISEEMKSLATVATTVMRVW